MMLTNRAKKVNPGKGDAMSRERYDSITGLRGFIAILTVMGYHYFILLGNPFEGGATATFLKNVVFIIGMTGPNAFFLMSGFLMHGRAEKRILTGELKFGAYLYGKIRKLYPMMLAGTLIVFAAERIGYEILGAFPVHASGGELRYSVLALILSILGVQSGWISDGDTLAVNGPGWFISCLMICYILYYIMCFECVLYRKSGKLFYRRADFIIQVRFLNGILL